MWKSNIIPLYDMYLKWIVWFAFLSCEYLLIIGDPGDQIELET